MESLPLLLVLGLAYFAPTIIAALRDHPSVGSIFVVNLFFGWTLIVWVIVLAWSVGGITRPAKPTT